MWGGGFDLARGGVVYRTRGASTGGGEREEFEGAGRRQGQEEK